MCVRASCGFSVADLGARTRAALRASDACADARTSAELVVIKTEPYAGLRSADAADARTRTGSRSCSAASETTSASHTAAGAAGAHATASAQTTSEVATAEGAANTAAQATNSAADTAAQA